MSATLWHQWHILAWAVYSAGLCHAVYTGIKLRVPAVHIAALSLTWPWWYGAAVWYDMKKQWKQWVANKRTDPQQGNDSTNV